MSALMSNELTMRAKGNKKRKGSPWRLASIIIAGLIYSTLHVIIFDPPTRFDDLEVTTGTFLNFTGSGRRSFAKIYLDVQGKTVMFLQPVTTEQENKRYKMLIGESVKIHYKKIRTVFLLSYERHVVEVYANGMFVHKAKDGMYERERAIQKFHLLSLPALILLLAWCLWKSFRHKTQNTT